MGNGSDVSLDQSFKGGFHFSKHADAKTWCSVGGVKLLKHEVQNRHCGVHVQAEIFGPACAEIFDWSLHWCEMIDSSEVKFHNPDDRVDTLTPLQERCD